MNERLLLDFAKVQADRRPAQAFAGRAGVSAGALEATPLARHLLGFGAALLVNVAVLGALQLSADAARPTPRGQVVITQLDAPTPPQLARN